MFIKLTLGWIAISGLTTLFLMRVFALTKRRPEAKTYEMPLPHPAPSMQV